MALFVAKRFARDSSVTVFLGLPFDLRLFIVFVVGVLIGTQINRAIYRLAWFQRDIGPWLPPHREALPRQSIDRIPIVGWFFQRRESPIHGSTFWIRPLLIELFVGLAFAALYWFEVEKFGVTRMNIGAAALHIQFVSHVILLTLMIVATFIDFDEQTIPDAITLPGLLLGLIMAAAFPVSRALIRVPTGVGYGPDYLHIGSGQALPGYSGWPAWLNGHWGLAIGIGCFLAWCLAVMPWTWTMRRGFGKAIQYFFASLTRRQATIPLAILAVLGPLAITAVWWSGGERWESLLSAIVGMAVGGGTIWAVRIVGTQALGQEAMGFGDVTLMAMVGAFTGWQPTLIIFFLAPFAAIFIAVAQYLLTRRHDIAFGPYLCLSTTIWILFPFPLWRDYGLPIFSLGWLVPAIGACGLLLMGGMLGVWRMIRDVLFPYEELEIQPVPPSVDGAYVESWLRRSIVNRTHPLRTAASLQPKLGPIPPFQPLSHRPLPPHARNR